MTRDNDDQNDLLDDLTPVQRRRLKTSIRINDTTADRIAYQHTVLCQTCLPYRNPGDSVRIWERQQGAISLAVEAGRVRDPRTQKFVEVGLPYGSRPRLILAHLNREALLRGSPRIEVESSLTAFIKRVLNNDSPNTREIGRFKDQLTRFAAALVRMAVDLPDIRAYQVNAHIIDAFDLWLGKDERQRVLWPAVVELSPRYFDSLSKHAVPLDERAIGALANSPLALDVYAWLAQRLCRIRPKREQFVTWTALQDQFGFGYSRIRAFREHFRAVLTAVHAQYRAAKFELDDRGMSLRYSLPPIHGHHLDLIKDD
jgi:hypothetical protein